jgi:hypothetical protein
MADVGLAWFVAIRRGDQTAFVAPNHHPPRLHNRLKRRTHASARGASPYRYPQRHAYRPGAPVDPATSFRRELSADVVVDLASGQVPYHVCGELWRGLDSIGR